MNFNPVFLNLIQKMTHPEKGIHASGESPKFLFADLIQVAPVQNSQNSEFVPVMMSKSQDEMSNELAVSSPIPLNIILPSEVLDTLISEISIESTPLQQEQISLELTADKLSNILNKTTSDPIFNTAGKTEELNLNISSLKIPFESEKIIEALQSGKSVILNDRQNAELKVVMEPLTDRDQNITKAIMSDISSSDDKSTIEYKGFVFNRDSLLMARDNNRHAMPAIKTPNPEIVNKSMSSEDLGLNKVQTEIKTIENSVKLSEPIVKDSGELRLNDNSSIGSTLTDLFEGYKDKPDVIKISIHHTQQVNNSPELQAAQSPIMLKKEKLISGEQKILLHDPGKNYGTTKNDNTQLSINEEVSFEDVLELKPAITVDGKKSTENVTQAITLPDSKSNTDTDFIDALASEESDKQVNSPDNKQMEEKPSHIPEKHNHNPSKINDDLNLPGTATKTEAGPMIINRVNTNSGSEVYRTIIHIKEAAPEIVRIVASGEYKSLELKLVPRELGKVRVLIDSADSNISLKIEVETEAAKEIIHISLSNLAGKFSADNLILQNVSINLMPKEKGSDVPVNGKRKVQKQEKSGETEPETIKAPKNLGYNTYDYLV